MLITFFFRGSKILHNGASTLLSHFTPFRLCRLKINPLNKEILWLYIRRIKKQTFFLNNLVKNFKVNENNTFLKNFFQDISLTKFKFFSFAKVIMVLKKSYLKKEKKKALFMVSSF